MANYGKEFVLDIHNCDSAKFTRGDIRNYFKKLRILTIHTLDLIKRVHLNIFTCKDFDPEAAKQFTADWFAGEIVAAHIIERI